jgi:macrolide transport system ATP-binding/permease protein
LASETSPLISLRDVTRSFPSGEETVTVLSDIDLDIWPGEMVAIVGASGSGKSTLMNILGCLDRPSDGTYRFAGEDVGHLDEGARARLRREHFGFIFQRYQLLAELDAVGNVEIPAIYRGTAPGRRRTTAASILGQLGLGDRLHHRPAQLSGGQQQRVSVARALVNGGEVILADEPTGALDSRSGADLIALLTDLNAKGHTIVIVTHDPALAEKVGRTIEIRDGRILRDTGPVSRGDGTRMKIDRPPRARLAAIADRLSEATGMAFRSMMAHRLRTLLTMLGIIIGIAAVVSVVALGVGSRERVLAEIASIGTNTIDIRPGAGFGDRRAAAIKTLGPDDAAALAAQPFAVSASPEVAASVRVSRGNVTTSARARGVGPGYFDLAAFSVTGGRVFDAGAISRRDQTVVLDTDAVKTLFPDGGNPIGETVLIGRVPMRVVATVNRTGTTFGPQTIGVYMPYTTVATRLTGQTSIDSISVRIADDYDMSVAEGLITEIMIARNGKQDFFLTNSDAIRNTITSTTETLTLLISSIAVISLLVGGIGVMNIMLVSVTERTREIGVRMSVGARRSDIVMQFLIEAVLVCLAGGVLGVLLALGLGEVASRFVERIPLAFSWQVAAAAFAAASVIGIIFGFLPARSAARLDPVMALARE